MLALHGTSQVRHCLFRRQFVVPGNWSEGRVLLWVRSSGSATFWDTGRVFLDGRVIQEPGADGVTGSEVGGVLKPGSTHVLAVEVTAKSSLAGVAGSAWLAYHPAPASQQELAGEWEVSADALRFTTRAALPGTFDGGIARRMVKIDAAVASKTVVFHSKSNRSSVRGVIVNGRSVTPFDSHLGPELNLNITPWVKFGSENELLVVVDGKGTLEELTLEFHKKETYP